MSGSESGFIQPLVIHLDPVNKPMRCGLNVPSLFSHIQKPSTPTLGLVSCSTGLLTRVTAYGPSHGLLRIGHLPLFSTCRPLTRRLSYHFRKQSVSLFMIFLSPPVRYTFCVNPHAVNLSPHHDPHLVRNTCIRHICTLDSL